MGDTQRTLVASFLAAQAKDNRRLERAALQYHAAGPVVVSSKRTMVWHGDDEFGSDSSRELSNPGEQKIKQGCVHYNLPIQCCC